MLVATTKHHPRSFTPVLAVVAVAALLPAPLTMAGGPARPTVGAASEGPLQQVAHVSSLPGDAEQDRQRRLAERRDHLAAVELATPRGEGDRSKAIELASPSFYWRHAYGTTYLVMSTVRNTGSTTPCFVKIFMDLRSSSGQVLASDWTYIFGTNRTLTTIDLETDTCLTPGDTGFFGAYVDVDISRVQSVAYNFEIDHPSIAVPDARIVVTSGPAATDWYGSTRLTGTLKNTGQAHAKFVMIAAAARDVSGALLDVDFTFVDGDLVDGTDSGLWRQSSGPFTMYTEAPSSAYRSSIHKTSWDDYGASCSYSISPSSASFGAAGGTGSVGVSAGAGCTWTAASQASWLQITSGASGSGPGTVGYRVLQNTGSGSRSGTVTIAGRSFTVRQDALSCSYDIAPQSAAVGAEGGVGMFNVDTSAGCTWTATTSNWWIDVTGGAAGVGPAPVSYRVTANPNPEPRTGRIAVAGHEVTIQQAGSEAPPAGASVHLGGVAHASGAGGSRWRTSLSLCNPGPDPAEVELTYRGAMGELAEAALTVPAYGSAAFDDVLSEAFGLEASSVGAIELRPSSAVVATTRTYNVSSVGTFGQAMPAIEPADALRRNETGVLGRIERTAETRTNIGLLNLGESTARVQIGFVSSAGFELGRVLEAEVPAHSWVQLNDAPGTAGLTTLEGGWALLSVLTEDTPVWAAASLVDNRTGDPTTVPMTVPEAR